MKKEAKIVKNLKKSKTSDKDKFEFSKELSTNKKIADILGDRVKNRHRNLPS